jgi:hypothetical protein
VTDKVTGNVTDSGDAAPHVQPRRESGSTWKERVLVAFIAVVVLAAILTGAYYREELTTYTRLHGWDSASAEKLVRDFVRKAHEGDPAAASALDGDRAKAVMDGGKIASIAHMGERGPSSVKIKDLVPTGEIKSTSSRIRYVSKIFGVAVQYGDGQWAEFGVDRTGGGLKIVDVSDMLGSEKLLQRD